MRQVEYVQYEFSNLKIEKRISQRFRSYYSYKLRLLHELRDQFILFN